MLDRFKRWGVSVPTQRAHSETNWLAGYAPPVHQTPFDHLSTHHTTTHDSPLPPLLVLTSADMLTLMLPYFPRTGTGGSV